VLKALGAFNDLHSSFMVLKLEIGLHNRHHFRRSPYTDSVAINTAGSTFLRLWYRHEEVDPLQKVDLKVRSPSRPY